MEYSIGEFSNITGLSIYTLRYYESENLLAPARRDNGRRVYSENDIAWVAFILRLKETNMPIKEIQRYATLRAQGDTTMEARRDLLTQHRTELCASICKLRNHLQKLDEKILFYDNEIAKQK